MRYLVLLYGDDRAWEGLDERGRRSVLDAHDAFDVAVRDVGEMLVGSALGGSDAATVLRHDEHGTATLSDGPYPDTPDTLGGFYVIEVADLDRLTSLCALLPHDYTVELHPLIDVG